MTDVPNPVSAKHLYVAAAVVALALVGGMALHAWMSTAKNVAQAEQVRRDEAPVHQQAQQEKQSAAKSEDANQRALSGALATLAAQRSQPVAAPVDYERIGQMIETRVAGVKAQVSAPSNTSNTSNTLPDAPSSVQVTGPDAAKKLRDYMLDCDQAKAEYGSCKVTVANLTSQLDGEKKDHQATRLELAAARKAMKGGGFWQRFKGNKNWFIGGATVGAVVAAVVKR